MWGVWVVERVIKPQVVVVKKTEVTSALSWLVLFLHDPCIPMAEVLKRHSRVVYLALLALRLLFALFGTGYIHPDEFFQNGEAVVGADTLLHPEASAKLSSRTCPWTSYSINMGMGSNISMSLHCSRVGDYWNPPHGREIAVAKPRTVPEDYLRRGEVVFLPLLPSPG